MLIELNILLLPMSNELINFYISLTIPCSLLNRLDICCVLMCKPGHEEEAGGISSSYHC